MKTEEPLVENITMAEAWNHLKNYFETRSCYAFEQQ